MVRFLARQAGCSVDDNDPPCDIAVRGTYTRHDFRTTDDPAKVPYFADDPERIQREWYGQGVNHRVEHGQIARSFENCPCWFVDVASVEQLVALARNCEGARVEWDLSSDDPLLILGGLES